MKLHLQDLELIHSNPFIRFLLSTSGYIVRQIYISIGNVGLLIPQVIYLGCMRPVTVILSFVRYEVRCQEARGFMFAQILTLHTWPFCIIVFWHWMIYFPCAGSNFSLWNSESFTAVLILWVNRIKMCYNSSVHDELRLSCN